MAVDVSRGLRRQSSGVTRFLRIQLWPFIALLCHASGNDKALSLEIPIKRHHRWRSNWTSAEMVLAQCSQFECLANYNDLQYVGSVEIGSPPQTLSVCLDTGSADLWVDGGLLDQHSSTMQCPTGGCEKSTEIKYSRGDVKGIIRVDSVRFGSSVPFDQAFILAEEITGLSARDFDGVLGLAFDKLSHTGTTIMQQLMTVADSFCFYLVDNDEQSWFVLGQPRPEWSEGDFTYSPVVVKAWWTFEAALGVGGTLLIEKSCFALDTGTSYLTVPDVDYEKTVDHILPKSLRNNDDHGCRFEQGGTWTCLCSVRNFMDISYLLLNNKAFPIFPEDIMQPIGGASFSAGAGAPGRYILQECTLQIQQSGNNLPWILGDTFLRTVVPIFDMKNSRIGLALRKNHKPLLTETQDKLARSCVTHSVCRWRDPVLKPFYPGANSWSMLWWAIPLVVCGGVCIGVILGTVIAKAIDLVCPPKRQQVAALPPTGGQAAPATKQGRAAAAAEVCDIQAPYVQLA